LYAELEQAGLSVATRRLVHAVIGRALRDAERWGRVPRNVARLADPPSRGQSRAQAWTAGELRRFLEHVHDDRLFAMWRLAATTGMRRGELAGLTWRALDLDGARLHVAQQLVPTRGGATLGPPKSARSRRTVALDPETVARAADAPRDAAARARLRRTGLRRPRSRVRGRARRLDPPAPGHRFRLPAGTLVYHGSRLEIADDVKTRGLRPRKPTGPYGN
jgi:integrase